MQAQVAPTCGQREAPLPGEVVLKDPAEADMKEEAAETKRPYKARKASK